MRWPGYLKMAPQMKSVRELRTKCGG
ncbi:hypothetical protein LCGC14_0401400, partial [marine sediment metagenome]